MGDLVVDEGFAVLNDFNADAKKKSDKGHDDPIPRTKFASYIDALSVSDAHKATFLQDCSRVFTARTKEDSEGYSTGSTYFLPAVMQPRCALEELAQKIFCAHVDTLDKSLWDPERSGSEWWTLVLDSGDSNGKAPISGDDDEEEEEEEEEEVGFHFDADYGLEEQLPNFLLHPRVSTITYLSSTGVPTLILDKRSPPPSDKDKTSLTGNINTGWLSHPSFGKHVAFDGRFLHGAPGEVFPRLSNGSSKQPAQPKASKRQKIEANHIKESKRVTFLVNIWLNHCPLESEPLEEEIIDELTTPWSKSSDGTAKSNGGDPSEPLFDWKIKDICLHDDLEEAVEINKNETPSGVHTEEAVICNRHVDVMFGTSMETLQTASTKAAEAKSKSAMLNMEDGVISLLVGEEVSSDEEAE